MLQQFTWQQFLVASMVLSLIWYACVILVFYRNEFLKILSKRGSSTSKEKLPHRWDEKVDQLNDKVLQEDDLMGKPKLPDGVSAVAMGSFGFMQTEDEKQIQIGLVPDVLEELKGIFKLMEKEDGNKTDFFNLMEMVRGKFPNVGSNPNIWWINQFISEHAPFHLSVEELENLWK